MNVADKNSVARFVELAVAFAGSGYRVRDFVEMDDVAVTEETAEIADSAPPNIATPQCGIAAPPLPTPSSTGEDSLEQVAADVRACRACRLCETRTNAVPGEGAHKPLVMVIGEGPGADEDASGRPFVGRAGQLLDKMLASIGLYRDSNCFIANVVKCRPPGNRDPQPDETAACASFLERQIALLQPRFILAAGKIATQTLLKNSEPISKQRGKIIDYQSRNATIPFLATYHPSALLHDDTYKRPAWEDLKLLRARLDSGE